VPKSTLRAADFSFAISQHGVVARGQAANGRYGAHWERHPRYRPHAGSQPDDGHHCAQKKAHNLRQVNPVFVTTGEGVAPAVVVCKVEEAELDEMWSFVGRKQHPRFHPADKAANDKQVISYDEQIAVLIPESTRRPLRRDERGKAVSRGCV
jgi:hypothetical protein